jgi:hypothetical protein
MRFHHPPSVRDALSLLTPRCRAAAASWAQQPMTPRLVLAPLAHARFRAPGLKARWPSGRHLRFADVAGRRTNKHRVRPLAAVPTRQATATRRAAAGAARARGQRRRCGAASMAACTAVGAGAAALAERQWDLAAERCASPALSEGTLGACLDWLLDSEGGIGGGGEGEGSGGAAATLTALDEPSGDACGALVPPPLPEESPPALRCLDRTHSLNCSRCVPRRRALSAGCCAVRADHERSLLFSSAESRRAPGARRRRRRTRRGSTSWCRPAARARRKDAPRALASRGLALGTSSQAQPSSVTAQRLTLSAPRVPSAPQAARAARRKPRVEQ